MNGKKHEIRFLLGILFMIIGTATVFAQDRKISGVVKDNFGDPIIGANVMVKGTAIGAATDLDGNYSLDAPANAKTLQVSYIGMRDIEVAISGSVVNITMEEDIASLDELVVIGYGTMKNQFVVFNQSASKIRKNNHYGNHGFLKIINDQNEVSFYCSTDGNN